jgi:hypothetical protein
MVRLWNGLDKKEQDSSPLLLTPRTKRSKLEKIYHLVSSAVKSIQAREKQLQDIHKENILEINGSSSNKPE